MSGDKEDLWQKLTRGITPIKRDRVLTSQKAKTAKLRAQKNKTLHDDKVYAVKEKSPAKHGSAQNKRDIDGHTRRKLERGKIKIDATIDLHGMRVHQAHDYVIKTINQAYARSYRCVLVITGKGERNQGVLRTKLPQWVKETTLSDIVLSITPAHIKDGGKGAYYIYLRRNK